MALLTPRHVIEAYNEALLELKATDTSLARALLTLHDERNEHRKTRRKLQVAQGEIETLTAQVRRLISGNQELRIKVDWMNEQNSRQMREIQVLRSQL